MTSDFWRGRRCFLTGHTGFKGSWLALWLQSLGAKVTGYALAPPTELNLYDLAEVGQGMDSVIADIRDLESLQRAMHSARPEIVFHLAAQALVLESYSKPVDTYSVNIMGTVNVLEAVRQTPGVKAVVNVTTDKCYENREWTWGYREIDPMGGYDPYSSSKACAELVSAAYRTSFFNAARYAEHGVALATARAGNVIGGGDWAMNRLIPDILSSFEAGKPAIIRHPNAIRPWQHVMEPLRGYLLLAQHLYSEGPAFAEGWNFGPNNDDARSVGWIADQLARQWGLNAGWLADKGVHLHEANALKLDISKARSRLKWCPAMHLEDALDLVVAWNQQRLNGANVRAVTLEQIQIYRELTNVKKP